MSLWRCGPISFDKVVSGSTGDRQGSVVVVSSGIFVVVVTDTVPTVVVVTIELDDVLTLVVWVFLLDDAVGKIRIGGLVANVEGGYTAKKLLHGCFYLYLYKVSSAVTNRSNVANVQVLLPKSP